MAPERAAGPASPDPLKASCSRCGGAVPVSLGAASSPCPFCGTPDPFERGLKETLQRLSRKLGERSAREQQLVGKQARVGRARGAGLFLAGILPIWLLAGSVVYFAIPATGAPPLLEFLFRSRAAHGAFDPVNARWWVLWAMVTGFALTLALFGAAVVAARRVLRFAFPLPPASEGAPPRCRCCGAVLPDSGLARLSHQPSAAPADRPAPASSGSVGRLDVVHDYDCGGLGRLPCIHGPLHRFASSPGEKAGLVRRCLYCGVDHVVMGARYQELEATLDASLASMERRLDVTLAARMRRANRVLVLAGTLPIAVAVLAPVGLFLGATRPVLWLPTGLLLLAGAALLAIGARMPVPKVRTVEDAEPGDALLMDGNPLPVEAVLTLGANSPIGGSILVLGDGGIALHVDRDADDRFTASRLDVRAGGEPWSDKGDTTELYPVTASGKAAWPWVSADGLLSLARFPAEDRRRWTLSLWKRGTHPAPGLAPDWTLASVEDVSEERVVLSSKEPDGGRE